MPDPLSYNVNLTEIVQANILNSVLPPILNPIPPSTPSQWVYIGATSDGGYVTGIKSSKKEKKYMELFHNAPLAQIVSFRNGLKEGLIGLEVEVEGKNLLGSTFKYWSCHQDGSLREVEGHPAVEYVLRQPLSIEETRKALEFLYYKLQDNKSEVIMSNRCSVHVHFNCQQYTIRQLYCFILLYMIFEEVLIDWASPERAGNLFCLRAKDSEYIIRMLEFALEHKTLSDWKEDMRYSACNISAIPKFGSLEFRALKGTIDPELIMLWVNLLNNIRVKAEGYKNPIDIVEEFSELGPLLFFSKIFDDHQLNVLLSPIPSLSNKLWDGLRMMRDVAYKIDWSDTAPKKKRVVRKRKKPIVQVV